MGPRILNVAFSGWGPLHGNGVKERRRRLQSIWKKRQFQALLWTARSVIIGISPRGCGNKTHLIYLDYPSPPPPPDASGPQLSLIPPLFLLPSKMSTFAAILTLLFFSGSAVAQISAPNCTYPSLYDWVRKKNPRRLLAGVFPPVFRHG